MVAHYPVGERRTQKMSGRGRHTSHLSNHGHRGPPAWSQGSPIDGRGEVSSFRLRGDALALSGPEELMPAVIGTSPQPWKLGLRSAPKTPRGHGKCPSTLFKEFWQLAGTHFTMAWARSHGESGCPRLCGIAELRGVRYPRPWLV